eukprot:1312884-Amphidinium_carterae.1
MLRHMHAGVQPHLCVNSTARRLPMASGPAMSHQMFSWLTQRPPASAWFSHEDSGGVHEHDHSHLCATSRRHDGIVKDESLHRPWYVPGVSILAEGAKVELGKYK